MAGDGDKKVIVIAIDKSKHAEDTFEWYAGCIHRPDHQLLLVHVPEMPEAMCTSSASLSAPAWEAVWSKENAEVAKMQGLYEKRLQELGMHGEWKTLHMAVQPGEGIINEARERKASLIVMGTRGLGTFRRTIMGSVSDYVLHHAHLPVAICRK